MKPRHAAALALVIWYVLSLLPSWAQSHAALKTFTAPDGAFSFRYSDQLIRCVKDPNGKHTRASIKNCSDYYDSLCDDLPNPGHGQTSIACFAYLDDKFTDTPAFQAATFSVEVVDEHTTAKSCLAGDEGVDDTDKQGTTKINGVSFTKFQLSNAGSNHGIGVDLYRTFHNGRCYQLGIDESATNSQVFDPPVKEPDWREVFRTLDVPLKSFRFLK